MRNKTTAALLAFFLGAFGAQYFYLGRVGAGVACILFCWTFIPCFIAVYHFIKFLVISDESFNNHYNRELLSATAARQPVPVMQHSSYQRSAPAPPVPQPTPQMMTRVVAQPPAAASFNLTDELERLFVLKEKGALTEEEYLVRKAKILA